jgi:hypothetical protein
MGFLEEKGGLLTIKYLGVRNTLESLEDAAFTKINANVAGDAQMLANTTVAGIKKLGCLAGSVAALKGEGVAGAANAANDKILGLYVNDLAGNAYESSSAASSDKGVYVCGMGTYEVTVYETADVSGATIMSDYQYGKKLYSSVHGLLTVEEGLASLPADAIVIGIITKAPSGNDPVLLFNLRI